MLLSCDPPLGGTVRIEADPPLMLHGDVLYVPTGRQKRDEGLFDRQHRHIEAAGYFRAHPDRVALHPPVNPLPHEKFDYAPDDWHYLFLGDLTGHYGHFLTHSLSRLWALDRVDRARTKLLLLNHGPLATPWAIPWVRDILEAFGVGLDDLVNFAGPTRLRQVLVPSPAFEEGGFVHAVFGRACGEAGGRMAADLRPGGRPVFLTKMHLRSGIGRIVNEEVLCRRLEDAGYEIVAPERWLIADQVRLFSERPVIAGMAGSAMHTSIFAPGRRKIELHPTALRLSNQSLIDRANGGETIALYEEDCIRCPPEPGFGSCYRLADPERTADALLRRIGG